MTKIASPYAHNPTAPESEDAASPWLFDKFKRLYKEDAKFVRFYSGEVVLKTSALEHAAASGKYYRGVHMSLMSSRSKAGLAFVYADNTPVPATHLDTQNLLIQWSTKRVVRAGANLCNYKHADGIPECFGGFTAYVPGPNCDVIGAPIAITLPYKNAPEDLREQYETLRNQVVAEEAIFPSGVTWPQQPLELGGSECDQMLKAPYANLLPHQKRAPIQTTSPRYLTTVDHISVAYEQPAAAMRHIIPHKCQHLFTVKDG